MGVNDRDKPSRAVLARRRNARERRTRVTADGGCRLDLLLPANAALALERVKSATGESGTAVIARLLLQEAEKG